MCQAFVSCGYPYVGQIVMNVLQHVYLRLWLPFPFLFFKSLEYPKDLELEASSNPPFLPRTQQCKSTASRSKGCLTKDQFFCLLLAEQKPENKAIVGCPSCPVGVVHLEKPLVENIYL